MQELVEDHFLQLLLEYKLIFSDSFMVQVWTVWKATDYGEQTLSDFSDHHVTGSAGPSPLARHWMAAFG